MLEQTYTKVPNHLLDNLAKTKLNGTQRRIIDIVLRYTFGFNRKAHNLSDGFISKATEINIRQVNREINYLINQNIIVVYYPGDRVKSRIIGLNIDTETWLYISKDKGADKLNSTDRLDSTDKLVLKGTDQLVPACTDELDSKERNNKEKYKEKYLGLLNYWNKKNIVKHQPNEKMLKQIERGIKKYGYENIIIAIDNYVTILSDKNYFYKNIWRLDNFLKQFNGAYAFLEDGQTWLNYKAQCRTTNPELDIYNVNGR